MQTSIDEIVPELRRMHDLQDCRPEMVNVLLFITSWPVGWSGKKQLSMSGVVDDNALHADTVKQLVVVAMKSL